MRALRTFLIALPVALILSWQTAPAFWHGAAIASLISLITGNVTVYVNPNGSGTTPCGVSGASTCQAGSDTNSCLTISAPCKTFQNAVYVMNQTLLWGFNIGTAKIYLGNGAYLETVIFGATLGFPKKVTSVGSIYEYNGVEVIGNDTTPADVIVSPPNGTCNTGNAWTSNGAVLAFQQAATYFIHGFTVTAANEATYQCDVIATWSGSHVTLEATMDLGPAAGGGKIFNEGGGGEVAVVLANVTIGTSVTDAFLEIFNGALFLDDGGTINFVDSGTLATVGFNTGFIMADGSGHSTFGAFDTVTGGIASGACYWVTGSAYIEGNSGGTLNQQLVSGCSIASSVAQEGVNFQGYVNAKALATHTDYNFPAPPAVSSCGSGASLSSAATDSSGTVTVGSGATGCTITFGNTTFLNLPDCTATDSLGAQVPTINTSGSDYVGWTVTGSLTGKLVYHCLFHL